MYHSQIILNMFQEKGLSAYKVSKETGISESLFSKWKANPTSEISSKNLAKIADYLGVSTDYLLGRTNTGTEINSRNTITGNYNVFGNNNSQISIKDELSSQEQELIARFRELSEIEKAKTLLNVTEMCEKR